MNKVLLTALFALLAGTFQAQFVVEQTYTIEEYVNDILLGSGISATNITYSGDELQLGYLTNGDDPGNFPMEGGLILSTDNALNSQLDMFGDPIMGGIGDDQDLLDIANSVPPLIGQSFTVGDVNDLCILEFDFIATGDTVSFNYSFGSDEWTTYINSTFNDVFAFFLSGPGIVGEWDSPAAFPDGAINIAYVPDTDPELPITISSVHNGNPDGTDCMNCEYYVYNNPNEDIQINAYTTLFTASSPVICGETYHIKLAIADGSDGALKSMVVLEEGSFSSNSVVQVDLSIDVGGPDANTIYEDCGEATLSFTRPIETILEIEEMVFIEYGGDAIEGLDYNDLPDTVIFAPFVETVSFTVDAFEDGLVEGLELVELEILNLAACNGGGLTSYFEFYIGDEPDPLVVEGYDQEICLGDTVELEPIITGGYGNFIFEWDSGEDTETIIVAPGVDTGYSLTVSDTCGMPSDDADFQVDILIVDPLEVSIDQGDFTIDCGGNMPLTATAIGGDGNYSDWYWYTDTGANLWGWNNSVTYWAWNGADSVYVDVTDGCGFTATNGVEVTMNVPELILDYEDITALCLEDFTVDPGVSGGAEPYWYTWTIDGIVDWSIWTETYTTSSAEDMVFEINVNDNCGQNELATINVTIESPDIEITMPESPTGNCVEEFEIDPVIEGGSGGFQYTWTDNGTTVGTASSIDYVAGETTTLTFSVEDQCNAFAEETIDLNVVNPPIELSLGEDIEASCIDNTLITPEVSSGSTPYQFQWTVNNDVVGTGNTLTWQSFETVEVQLNVSDVCDEQAEDAMVIVIPNIPLTMEVSDGADVCQFEEVQLTASAGGGEGGFEYEWNVIPGSDTTQVVAPGETTLYEVVATDICGEQINGQILITVHPIDVGYGQTYESASSVQYTSVVMPDCEDCEYDYLWDFGDGAFSNEVNPLHQYDGLDSYEGSLVVTNWLGCQDSTEFSYMPPISLYIPNSFTPNNDGINDYFEVYGDGIESYEIFIYNRWGIEVFHSNDIEDVWLGEVQGGEHYYTIDGVYNYVIKLKGYNTDAFIQKGTVTVLR